MGQAARNRTSALNKLARLDSAAIHKASPACGSFGGVAARVSVAKNPGAPHRMMGDEARRCHCAAVRVAVTATCPQRKRLPALEATSRRCRASKRRRDMPQGYARTFGGAKQAPN